MLGSYKPVVRVLTSLSCLFLLFPCAVVLFQAGVEDIEFTARLHISMSPMLNEIPVVGAIQVGFRVRAGGIAHVQGRVWGSRLELRT